MMLYLLASLFFAGYFFMLLNGLRLHKELERLQKNIDTNGPQSIAQSPEHAYINHLYCTLTGKEKTLHHNTTETPNPHASLGANAAPDRIKNALVGFLGNFIDQHNDSFGANIKLNVISGSCALAFKDSVSVLRIILQVAEKARENKIGPTSVFMLLVAPLQISIEITKPAGHDVYSLHRTIEQETLQSPTLHIIHYESNGVFERLVIGAVEDDEDNSSRRPRNFQREH